MIKRCIPAVSVLCVSSTFSFAAEPEPIVVTATRTAQTVDDSLASVSVITQDDLVSQQVQTVPEAIQGLAGVSLTNNGGLGKATSIHMRGTESDHTLILVDGIKVGSATLGTAAIQDLPIAQIERIEVVRGPRSSLYGSEAIGGVIQIFTKKGADGLKPTFHISGGSHATFSASTGLSGGDQNTWFNLNTSATTSQGFNACQGEAATAFAACFANEPDDDGYRNKSINLRAGHRFTNDLEVDFHALTTNSETEFDGGFVNESESQQEILSGKINYTANQYWHLSLLAANSRDDSDNFSDGLFKTKFNTQRISAAMQNDFSIGSQHLVTLGFDYGNDVIDTITDPDNVLQEFDVTSRDNKGVFTQYQGSYEGHQLQASWRRDDNEQYGEQDTGSIAWGFTLPSNLKLTASLGTAFKAPTFNELYFPEFGNPDLNPETSQSFELSAKNKAIWGNWSVSAFATEVEDLIGFDAMFLPANINEARIVGIETGMATQLNNWQINASLTLLDHENKSDDENDGNDLVRRPKESLNINANRNWSKFSVGATVSASGKSYDDLANTRELSAYATADIRSEYRMSKDWRVQARVENVFDKDYENASFYNQSGRSLTLTLRYQP